MVLADWSLREIAIAAGTDKESAHSYSAAYERHLQHLRERPIKLLEIGIGGYADTHLGGASLRMWKEYFPKAEIVGIDIFDKSSLAEDRITILQGDQSDPTFLEDLASRYGPFDVIIDDGSHICEHAIASFHGLFGSLADDGIYAIEDLQTSYWERGYGGSSASDRARTTIALLQSLVDGLNYAEFDIANYQPSVYDRKIVSLSFYHNLVFIQKGDNTEPSNVLPAHPRTSTMYVAPRPEPERRSTPSRNPARRLLRRLIPGVVRATVRRWLRRN